MNESEFLALRNSLGDICKYMKFTRMSIIQSDKTIKRGLYKVQLVFSKRQLTRFGGLMVLGRFQKEVIFVYEG